MKSSGSGEKIPFATLDKRRQMTDCAFGRDRIFFREELSENLLVIKVWTFIQEANVRIPYETQLYYK